MESRLRHILAFALIIQMLMAGPVARAQPDSPSGHGIPPLGEQPIMLNQKFVIPVSEMPGLKEQALSGSGEAALRLSNYYDMVALDLGAGLRWLTIAAENGSIPGMYNLGQRLKMTGRPQDIVRARYWFGRVENEGQAPLAAAAKQRLREMDTGSR